MNFVGRNFVEFYYVQICFGKVKFYYLSKEKRERCASLRNVLVTFFSFGYYFWYSKTSYVLTQQKRYELATQNGENIQYLLEAKRPRPCSVNCRS